MHAQYGPNLKGPMLAMAGVLAAHLFVFIPITLYAGNSEEFATPLLELIRLWLIPALATLLVLVVFGIMLPGTVRVRFAPVLAALGMLCWMQATLLVWDYGLLDGRPIDWSKGSWRGWVDATLWILGIVLVVRLPVSRHAVLYRAALVVFLVHLGATAFTLFQSRDRLLALPHVSDTGSMEQASRFSKKVNVLHLLLDGFQADVFQDLMEHPQVGAGYRAALDGFVFYNEALSVFPYTQFSVPSYLGGHIYDNQIPKDAFLDDALSSKTILSTAVDKGFKVDLLIGDTYLTNRFRSSPYDQLINVDTLGASTNQADALKLVDLALFRAVPHFLKPAIYNEQKWLISAALSIGEHASLAFFRHTRFLETFAGTLTADRPEPVYKYIHIMNTHRPMVVDPQCRYAGQVLPDTRVTLTLQSKCTLDSVVFLLQKLKELGIYDDMLIVVHADHGGWVANRRQGKPIVDAAGHRVPPIIASLASPLLAIKRPGESGALRTVPTLASLLDLPDTISDIMGWQVSFGHRSLVDLEPDEKRTRRHHFYGWRPNEWNIQYTLPIQEFLIDGSHYEVEWQAGKVYRAPKSGTTAPSTK